jgi:ATP adenylyltransferase/5',5'''-P-1,P-4-tetraphosphate phosphorylase II
LAHYGFDEGGDFAERLEGFDSAGFGGVVLVRGDERIDFMHLDGRWPVLGGRMERGE